MRSGDERPEIGGETGTPSHLTTDLPSITPLITSTALVMDTLDLPLHIIGGGGGESRPLAMGHHLPRPGTAPAGTGVPTVQAIGEPLPHIEIGVHTVHLITQEEHLLLPYPLPLFFPGGCAALTVLAIINQEEVAHLPIALGVPSLLPLLEGHPHPAVIAVLVDGEALSVLDIVGDLRHHTTVVLKALITEAPLPFLFAGDIVLVSDEVQLLPQADTVGSPSAEDGEVPCLPQDIVVEGRRARATFPRTTETEKG